ncbi:hypothetical protein BGX29_011399 [Mortierella sp. GBA35]|nr:hypothetical protein BGX29_011399 [Mortierella sp. GBA35]
MSSSSSLSPSLKVQTLTSQNRAGVAQLVFDSHMKSVTPLFHFLKLRPLALLVWTAISTAILKYRQTSLRDYLEILTVLAGAVIVAQGVLFLTLLYEASTTAPGHKGVGKLEVFGDLDDQVVAGASSSSATGGAAKKRAATESVTTATTTTTGKDAEEEVKGGSLAGKDNKFIVLSKSSTGRVVGCIGAVKTKVKVVRVTLQGYQVPALRLFYKFGFVQVDRAPEWMGERVVLEMQVKDWSANLAKAQALKKD